MNAKTTPEQRRRFYERHLSGETYAEIAEDYGVSLECVRYWCRRQRDGGDCVTHSGRRPTGILSDFDPRVRFALLRIRLTNPRHGPAVLRWQLTQESQLRYQRLPSRTQIGRYLHQWSRFRRHARRVPPAKVRTPEPAQRLFQRWQFDFKLGIALVDGSQVNLHTLYDPVGAVCIAAVVTPAGKVGRQPAHVKLREAQATLRAGFARWHTLPEEVQTDREPVYIGSTDRDFPGALTLWLIGLGIQHVLSRPAKPTDNAFVERCHQTIHNYAMVQAQPDCLAAFQQALDVAVDELASALPSRAGDCAGQPPLVAHPALLQPTRPFSPEQELQRFDLERVDAYLAQWSGRRTVSATGQVCIGGWHQYYSVGRAYAHHQVLVCFDPSDRHFVFFQTQPPYAEIGRRPARHLEAADLIGLDTPGVTVGPQQLELPLMWPERVSC